MRQSLIKKAFNMNALNNRIKAYMHEHNGVIPNALLCNQKDFHELRELLGSECFRYAIPPQPEVAMVSPFTPIMSSMQVMDIHFVLCEAAREPTLARLE